MKPQQIDHVAITVAELERLEELPGTAVAWSFGLLGEHRDDVGDDRRPQPLDDLLGRPRTPAVGL